MNSLGMNSQNSGIYVLNSKGEGAREQLDDVLARPLALMYAKNSTLAASASVSDISDVSKDPDSLDFPTNTIQLDENNKSLIAQQAILATKAEYEALGENIESMQVAYLLRSGALMLTLALAGVAISILIGFLAARTGAQIARDLRAKQFAQVLSFSEKEIEEFSAASLITRATNDVQQVQQIIVMLLRMVFYAPILALGGIAMVIHTNAQMGWIVVVAIVVVFALVGILVKTTMPKFKLMQKLIDKLNLISREIISGTMVIRAFNREDFEEKRFDEASTQLMKTQLFTNRTMTFMMPAMMLIMNITSVAIVWIGASYVDVGTIQTGDLIAFITYAMTIIMSFLMLSMISIVLPRANVAALRIDEVLNCKPSVSDPEMLESADGEGELSNASAQGAHISFEDVSFSYDSNAENVLSHISFDIWPGCICGIVGATGSGKSSIIKLIERFFDVSAGAIKIDGKDVRSIKQYKLRAQLAYVPQKAFLFSGTIAQNVAYSNEDVDSEYIEQALKTAQATDFVHAKDKGMQTEISQGGTNVSGGQRQRLAIARACATHARAYLFDDCFSALDYKTDAALRSALTSQLAGKTQIIVAQRIASIMHADQIVVLENGRVAGIGTHKELLHTCKEYREIALSQLSKEELESDGLEIPASDGGDIR